MQHASYLSKDFFPVSPLLHTMNVSLVTLLSTNIRKVCGQFTSLDNVINYSLKSTAELNLMENACVHFLNDWTADI